ncbi:hypothetical protein [Sphingomonas sp. S2-65]|uniref:hypothetical protein n=1 Tax=Sphingomonas sp. S2-65 TaxID=2903960 RepID=UPI001F37AAD5|nr:hypothetical protein [Sphingomonas sp. S2-65]UYY57991.1 hypothetical protein LZ586_15205 [Sphingomonas sp. S2-65]
MHRDPVEVTLESRAVRSQKGRAEFGPSLIDFGQQRRRVLGAVGEDGVDGDLRKGRYRRSAQAREGEKSESTGKDIVRACEFFIRFPEARGNPLAISGLKAPIDRYRTVFKNLGVADLPVGQQRIWWSRVNLRSRPSWSGTVVRFALRRGACVEVDVGGWGRGASLFRQFVGSMFAAGEEAMSSRQEGEWAELLLFCFGRLDESGTVRVSDRRTFHMLVEVSARLSRRAEDGPDLDAFK